MGVILSRYRGPFRDICELDGWTKYLEGHKKKRPPGDCDDSGVWDESQINENYCPKQAPYRIQKGAFLTDRNKLFRLKKAKELLRDTLLRTVFTDEKLFAVEANKNGQNNRILAIDYESAYRKGKILNKTSHPAAVMILGGICSGGKTSLLFVDVGAKVNKEYYVY
ncbi:hypothetical protein B9Z55_025619 [Caenorhabditis nigoni]|uniref:Uncharacterized protein n=1 Tax=Caenorhabditis nigoni TaxID=1611254 RepID=A0A2G5SZY2_9PELO|nr:hypothetical protein B9Z55_025619 [Caenorhabditis nigoni]